MITLFTTAKPFMGQIKIVQINALKSWKLLAPDVEVILFGNGEGYAEIARELGLIHFPEVETTEQGTPLVNSMLALAQMHGQYPFKMYVNCDIILFQNLISAVRQIRWERFLMIGQRWDVDIDQEIRYTDPLWERRLTQQGRLHPPTGSDYFLYRGDIWQNLPKLVIGRAGYDNELIYHCRAARVPVVDASQVVTAVHQNHDYGHYLQGKEGVWHGPEAQMNLRASQGRKFILTLLDANWQLTAKGLVKNYCRGDWERYFSIQTVVRLGFGWKVGSIIGLKFLRIWRLLSQKLRSTNEGSPYEDI
jgi:hypothetical protein